MWKKNVDFWEQDPNIVPWDGIQNLFQVKAKHLVKVQGQYEGHLVSKSSFKQLKKLIFIHAEEKCRIGEQNPTTLAGDGNKNLVQIKAKLLVKVQGQYKGHSVPKFSFFVVHIKHSFGEQDPNFLARDGVETFFHVKAKHLVKVQGQYKGHLMPKSSLKQSILLNIIHVEEKRRFWGARSQYFGLGWCSKFILGQGQTFGKGPRPI